MPIWIETAGCVRCSSSAASETLFSRATVWNVIDASGVHALEALLERCQRRGIVLVVSGLQAQPRRVFAQMHLHPRPGMLHIVPGYDAALTLAEELLAGTATEDAPS